MSLPAPFLRRLLIASLIITATVLASQEALALRITTFEDGSGTEVLDIREPLLLASANFTIPASSVVLKASVNVTSAPLPEASSFPEDVALYLNDSLLWRFNGTGYGPLGRQDRFIDGNRSLKVRLNASGGSQSALIRLPKRADVIGAQATLGFDGPEKFLRSYYFGAAQGWPPLERCLASAGDVNGDGLRDLIIGSPYYGNGYAWVHWGGEKINSTADVELCGEKDQDNFGCSVSSGDFNGD